MIAVDTALLTLLKADATLVAAATGGIHKGEAPEDALPPFVEVVPLSSTPEYTFGATAWEDCDYYITGVGVETATRGPYEVAEALRDRAVALVTSRSGGVWTLTVSGVKVMRVWRARNLQPFSLRIGGVERVYAPADVSVRVTQLSGVPYGLP